MYAVVRLWFGFFFFSIKGGGSAVMQWECCDHSKGIHWRVEEGIACWVWISERYTYIHTYIFRWTILSCWPSGRYQQTDAYDRKEVVVSTVGLAFDEKNALSLSSSSNGGGLRCKLDLLQVRVLPWIGGYTIRTFVSCGSKMVSSFGRAGRHWKKAGRGIWVLCRAPSSSTVLPLQTNAD